MFSCHSSPCLPWSGAFVDPEHLNSLKNFPLKMPAKRLKSLAGIDSPVRLATNWFDRDYLLTVWVSVCLLISSSSSPTWHMQLAQIQCTTLMVRLNVCKNMKGHGIYIHPGCSYYITSIRLGSDLWAALQVWNVAFVLILLRSGIDRFNSVWFLK